MEKSRGTVRCPRQRDPRPDRAHTLRDGGGLDREMFPHKVLRVTPPVLAVQQLRGAAEMGAFHMTADPAAEATPPDGRDPVGLGPGPTGRETRGTMKSADSGGSS